LRGKSIPEKTPGVFLGPSIIEIYTMKNETDILDNWTLLSENEMITPIPVVKDMISLLPDDIFQDPNLKFLDPCTRSGRYLTNIGKRLLKGLEKWEPDADKRLTHIVHNMLFGVATSNVAGWLTRRELYGSIYAGKAKHAPARFDSEDGNIISSEIGNSNLFLDGEFPRTFAEKIGRKGEDMKFDVIIGNPPYQMRTGGAGVQATPIYNKFVLQAKRLDPQHLVMVIPDRWFAGGMGLGDFRKEMLEDKQMRKIIDFTNSTECFPGVDIPGGICYFLWSKNTDGDCEITNIFSGNESRSTRALNEFSTFIRLALSNLKQKMSWIS
jgi:site-specific DNA-methyltransferase (adenine-specific)